MAEEIVIGVVIGLLIGIIIIYAIMQSRVTKKAHMLATQMFENQKQDFKDVFLEEAQERFEKYKAEYEIHVRERIEDATQTSLNQSRSSLKGKIGEQLAPILPEFTSKYNPADARFIGSPIDYVIFKNMRNNSDEEAEPLEIVLLEVKTGNTPLTKIEKAVKDAIDNKRIQFDILRINNQSD